MKEFQLHGVQIRSLDKMSNMTSCVISLQCGCGKTRLVLEHARQEFSKGHRNLFVIPKSARSSFNKELSGRDSLFIDVTNKSDVTLSEICQHKYIVVENSILDRILDLLQNYCDGNSVNLYVDEAHSLQSGTSKLTQCLWTLRLKCLGAFLVTATPIVNSFEGLFNLYRFAYPKIFRRWSTFSNQYCNIREREVRIKDRSRKVKEIVSYKNMDELNAILDKLTVKGKVDYNVHYEFVSVDLNEELVPLYRKASNGLVNYTGTGDGKEFASRLHDLQLVVDGLNIDSSSLRPTFISNKIKECCAIINRICNREESVLVYFEYLDSLNMIKDFLTQNKDKIGIKKITVISGSQKEEERVFVETHIEPREVVLITMAGRESRNLQRSNNLIVYNTPFSIGSILQLTGRICRFDSKYSVQNIYFLKTEHTIDDYKISLFKDHLSLIDKLFGDEVRGTLTCPYVEIDREHLAALKHSTLWRM